MKQGVTESTGVKKTSEAHYGTTNLYTHNMPQYQCEFCKTPIFDISKGTYHLVRAWVKVGNNSNPRHVEKLHLYAHAVCAETAKAELANLTITDTLF